MNIQEKSRQIKEWALELGFDACGIAKADTLHENAECLKTWINKGFNADIKYMEKYFEERDDITKLVENAKSIVSVLSSYNPLYYPFKDKKLKMSRYTLVVDYHKTIIRKLDVLLKKINKNFGDVHGRAFVDSAPLFEKAWAAKAGLGWIGKNSLFINKKFGSFCFLGELVINTELEYDVQDQSNCGKCHKCIEKCPTGAIISPHFINANLCIAYNTIENKGPINEKILGKMNGWIYGCDICQEVCPWNNKPEISKKTEFISFDKLEKMTDSDWKNLSWEEFNTLFKNSPVKRAKYERLKRSIEANLNPDFSKSQTAS